MGRSISGDLVIRQTFEGLHHGGMIPHRAAARSTGVEEFLAIGDLGGPSGCFAPKFGIEPAPFVVGFILRPDAAIRFVERLESFGDPPIFFTESRISEIDVEARRHRTW